MARRRFLVEQIRDSTAELRGPDARHLARVLRAEPGQQYEISDGTQVCLAEVTAVEKDRVAFRVVESLAASTAAVRITLLAALIKFDRFEWLLEKATELGVAEVVPVNTARTTKGLYEAAQKRIERWRRIVHESSQQSRRLNPPVIAEAKPFAAALAGPYVLRFFLDEEPGAPPFAHAIPATPPGPADAVALMTGPEGGWTDSERSAALAAGWTPVSLGPPVLRAETAALAATVVLTHKCWATQLE